MAKYSEEEFNDDIAYLQSFKLKKIPLINDMDFDHVRGRSQKIIFRRLIIAESHCVRIREIRRFYKNPKNDLYPILEAWEEAEIVKFDHIHIWLNPKWAEEYRGFPKKSKRNKK